VANRDAGVGTNNRRSPGVAEPPTEPLLSPPPVPDLAAGEEPFVDVLAVGLAYLLDLLAVRLIRQMILLAR
jgi:hypothetical protein